jgi:hypothetical protein
MCSSFKRIFTILIALICVGCAATPEEMGRQASPGDGKVIISVGALPEGKRQFEYTAYGLFWRSVDGKEKGTVSYGPHYISYPAAAFPFRDTEGVGLVHVLSLKPGDYEIYNYILQLYRSTDSQNFYPPQPISLKFSVKANQITYVGRFIAEPYGHGGFLGMGGSGDGGFYYWLSRWDSDSKIVMQKMPDVAKFPLAENTVFGKSIPGAIKYLGGSPIEH